MAIDLLPDPHLWLPPKPAIVRPAGKRLIDDARIKRTTDGMLLVAPPFLTASIKPPEFIAAGSNTGTTLSSMPTHQAGDILVGIAYRANATAPSLPAGWTNHQNGALGSYSTRSAWKIAASASETSGTWTNAANLIIAVYRNLDPTTPLGAFARVNELVVNACVYPTIDSMQVADGSSWVMGVGFAQTGTTSFAAPSGMTLRLAGTRCGLSDTNAGVSGWTAQSGNIGTTATVFSLSIELRAAT